MRKKFLLGLVLLLMLTISGCSSADTVGDEPLSNSGAALPSETAAGHFSISLTRDFGRVSLDSREVELKSEFSLMKYMQEEHQVTVDFGGSFITGINGLESAAGAGENLDWFFFVNGSVASVGADQIKPAPGDVAWWDYHSWSNAAGPTAVIGCYPQPLVDRQVAILTDQRWMRLAKECQESLTALGVSEAEIAELNQEDSRLDKPVCPLIVIGTWPELQENTYLRKWNQAFERNGSSIHFTDDGLELLGADGKVQQILGEGTGVIVASSQGLGDNDPMWLIAGVDEQGVEQAVQVLCSQPDKLQWKCGLAVQAGQIIALPVDY